MNEYLAIFGDTIRIATFQVQRERGRYEPERTLWAVERRPRDPQWRGR